MLCPCGSEKEFTSCCEVIHKDHSRAHTAEQLMRARYSAFATQNIDFLKESHDPATVQSIDMNDTKEWAESAQWLGLEIHSTERGQESDETGMVEFTARFNSGAGPEAHYEKSIFHKKENRWFYSDRIDKPKPIVYEALPGRNDPCHCGSGKKFKKCCLNK